MLMLSGCTGGQFFHFPIRHIRSSSAGAIDIDFIDDISEGEPTTFMIPEWAWSKLPPHALTLNDWWLYDPDTPCPTITRPDWWDDTDTSVLIT